MAQAGRERVGIFGGTFDPIHVGHLQVAHAARERHALDRIIFVPARRQPMKRSAPAASGRHRVEMVQLAIEGERAFSVSDCELARPGKSFTIDTILAFRAELGPEAELFFIIGSDSVRDLPNWHEVENLAELCTLVVAARPGWPVDALDTLEGRLPAARIAAMKAAAVLCTANTTSSSEIRRRIAEGDPTDGLVPAVVAAYVAKNKLYSAA